MDFFERLKNTLERNKSKKGLTVQRVYGTVINKTVTNKAPNEAVDELKSMVEGFDAKQFGYVVMWRVPESIIVKINL